MTHATGGAMPIRVLVAEDEEHLGAILEHFLRGRGYAVTICRDGRSALETLSRVPYDVALLDVVMPELDGLEVLRRLQGDPSRPEVIIITGNGTIDTAITAIKLGAYDYISKPYRMAEIDVMVRRAWEKRELGRATAMLRRRLPPLPQQIHTENARMRSVVARVEAAAAGRDPLILCGEIGTGKHHLGRFAHARSGRPADSLVEVGGRGEPATRAELLGTATQPGAFALAERGTVLVDFDRLDAGAREALVDAMSDGEYTHADGGGRVALTARLVVCTRGDAVAALGSASVGAERLAIPPLRERPEDVGRIAAELLFSIVGPAHRLAADAVPVLAGYAWPGNVAELETVVRRAAMLAARPEVTGADFHLLLAAGSVSVAGTGGALSDLERMHIEAMLVRCNWHQGQAAMMLGISTKTLYRKMREYGFRRPRGRKLARSAPATGATTS
jgi:DNA-binding NtrC family response regulator